MQKRSVLYSAISVALLPISGMSLAQDDVNVEEVVVTGSYLRNSAFAQDANVSTVTQADLFESGAPSMETYIRDLTYTQNTDVVANVLASQDGGQDSVGASFNLRGLGENSTLQLVDGVRLIDQSINTTLPDIAVERLEVVLDGGSALYGSDAVAGVVNLIPIKEFNGFRTRNYYQVDEDNSMEDVKASFLWGRSFDNGIDYVGAFDWTAVTPLMQYERLREWEMDNGSSSSGNPGAWREIVGADDGVNLYQSHGGTSAGGNMVDPACGTFNDGAPGHGRGAFNTPSGVLTNGGQICRFEYTKQFAYRTEQTTYNLYNSVTWDVNDWLDLNLTAINTYRISDGRTTSTTATSANNRRVLLVRDDHPANPFGVDVSPWNWRLITEMYTHRPAHLDDISGSREFETHDSTNRFKLQADFELSDTWSGYAYYSDNELKQTVDSRSIHLGKLQLALQGLGGPSGNEYWNPFGSADPRFPGHDPAIHANSEELTAWLFEIQDNILDDRDFLDIFEFAVQGEVIDLWAGPLRMAAGFQWRDLTEQTFEVPLDKAGHDYNTAFDAPKPVDTEFFSEVKAAFVEFEVPVLDTVDLQLAVRHERFTDFGLDATTPKIAARWEVTPEFAVRGSWGESFLAPTPTQSRPFIPDENCFETFSGTDAFTDQPMTGSTRCSSGNPNLQPEESEIQNIGFTWQPGGVLDGLEVSMDYQEIEYTNRIRTLTEQDTVAFEFQNFLADTGISEANYDPTPGSSTRLAAEAWFADRSLQAGNPVRRFENFELDRIFRQAQNISSVWIDLFDAKIDYRFATDNMGTFNASWAVTYYTTYDYEDLFGGRVEALGFQNANTGIAPPLPELKYNFRLNWFMGDHSASITTNYWDEVQFDDRVFDNYGDGWEAPAGNIIHGESRTNLRYSYILSDFLSSDFTISAGINNVFEERPQQLPILGGFESRLSTPWGRQFWLSLEWNPQN